VTPSAPPGDDAGNGRVDHAHFQISGFQSRDFSLGIAFIGKAHKHPYHVIFVQCNEVSAMKPMVAGPDEKFRPGNFGVALKRLSFSAAPHPLRRG
jgi:hypothetical protein